MTSQSPVLLAAQIRFANVLGVEILKIAKAQPEQWFHEFGWACVMSVHDEPTTLARDELELFERLEGDQLRAYAILHLAVVAMDVKLAVFPGAVEYLRGANGALNFLSRAYGCLIEMGHAFLFSRRVLNMALAEGFSRQQIRAYGARGTT